MWVGSKTTRHETAFGFFKKCVVLFLDRLATPVERTIDEPFIISTEGHFSCQQLDNVLHPFLSRMLVNRMHAVHCPETLMTRNYAVHGAVHG